jgi:hypothetical protein
LGKRGKWIEGHFYGNGENKQERTPAKIISFSSS